MAKTATTKLSHKDRLLRSGWDLFYVNGYHATTVDSILSDAEVPKGSFYHHFGAKQAFGFAVLDRYDAYQQRALDTWSGRDDLTVPQRIEGYHRELVERFVASGWQRPCLLGKLSSELGPSSEDYRARISTSLREWRSQIARLIALGQERGELRDDLPAGTLADVFLALIEGAFVAALVLREQEYLDATTRVLLVYLEHASTVEQRQWHPRRRSSSRKRTDPTQTEMAHRERLLLTGIESFFEFGYHGTTVDRILAAAQVPKGSFYHHFGSKEAFAVGVLDAYGGFQDARLLAWSDDDGRSTPEMIYGYFTEMSQIFVDSDYRNSDLAGKLATEVATTSEPLRVKIAELVAQWRVRLEAVLTAGQERGDVRDDLTVAELSAAIHALIDGTFIVASATRDTGAISAVGAAIAELVAAPNDE
ncbi:TetR/AcrR family transcriptional regulator [Gordonia hydrophobica]|uniref:TetR/AcrR family transcriptional regulator n=1 Tax=Gordonia hydrophobica TaxID=40516 RepID=A0ABZ2U721_9ACTN|nr:TetR/AcrR family transcriptional regulator [Gordonia hydrophobica]MBM7368242.1 AcrR family transcriptional regulator [Gordonia hydrophobica]